MVEIEMPSERNLASTCAIWMISCAIDRRRLVFCISLLRITLQVSLTWLAQASCFSLKRFEEPLNEDETRDSTFESSRPPQPLGVCRMNHDG